MLDKTFSPAVFEGKQYARSLNAGAFALQGEGEPYTIMMPPPNVTGALHMGHALTFTLQDILIRYHRMRGRAVLWQPGTDHAGIATQMVVERLLNAEGITRQELGRDAFLERVWAWKASSGGTIVSQLKRLGASADWPRERFTLDDGLSQAVRTLFVSMYRDGLIYKDKRLVNWDVKLQTALSDLEVVSQDVDGAYYHIHYPFVEGAGGITVATTRPETLLGDVAVAVHPDNPNLKFAIGHHLRLPLTNRIIPVIADTYADPEKGTGAVKITPAHDGNDFEVGRRHGLPLINILNTDGTLNDAVPERFQGLERFAARKAVIQALEDEGFLVNIEPTRHAVPYGDRSGTVIEPLLTEQWYVRADILAKPALQAVAEGIVHFVPPSWKTTYDRWLEDIQPWCISRQLWWGHRIPAWYDEDGAVYVAETENEARALAGGKPLTQDPDVLDTWFSSGLWPFSTLGWPHIPDDLKGHYPGSVLVTGFDIIFFWVARMMMMGIYAHAKGGGYHDALMAGQPIPTEALAAAVPFRDVYIHALVRDKHGHKMSKSKGNVVDPLDLMDRYGADALRFTLAIMAAQGRDVKLDTARIEGYRNFATKLWNAARFGEMNGCVWDATFDPQTATLDENQWIITKLTDTLRAVGSALDGYAFDEAAQALYAFVWHEFCDWYVEFAKTIFIAKETWTEEESHETRKTFSWCLRQVLLMLHPFMPFITDEMAEALGHVDHPLTVEAWPKTMDLSEDFIGAAFLVEKSLKPRIEGLRSFRGLLGFAPQEKLVVYARAEDIMRYAKDHLLAMANCDITSEAFPKNGYKVPYSWLPEAFLYLSPTTDIGPLRERWHKKMDATQKDRVAVMARLNNPDFMAKAGDEVVSEHRARLKGFDLVEKTLKSAIEAVTPDTTLAKPKVPS
ncbi:MAG: valine--tRNA ligase [Alphaproteobacteria bacterium]